MDILIKHLIFLKAFEVPVSHCQFINFPKVEKIAFYLKCALYSHPAIFPTSDGDQHRGRSSAPVQPPGLDTFRVDKAQLGGSCHVSC